MVQKEKPVFQSTGDSGQGKTVGTVFVCKAPLWVFYLFLSQAYVYVWFIYVAKINHQAKNKVIRRDLFACIHAAQDRPANLTFWVLESLNFPQPRACVCLPGSAAFWVRSGVVVQRWGHCREWLIPSCVPAPIVLAGTLPSGSLCWFLSQEHSARFLMVSMVALMGKEFNQRWTLENSIHRRDIEDQGGKHQSGGWESDWQWDEINNVDLGLLRRVVSDISDIPSSGNT